MIPPQTNGGATDKTAVQPTGTEWAAILGPYILQATALISIALIVLIRDGASTDTVITSLLAFAIGNTVAGVIAGGTHTIVNARVRQTLAGAAAQTSVITAQSQATIDTAAAGVAPVGTTGTAGAGSITGGNAGSVPPVGYAAQPIPPSPNS